MSQILVKSLQHCWHSTQNWLRHNFLSNVASASFWSSVVMTLLAYGFFSMLAASALIIMLPYPEISVVVGFSTAFGANGWIWAEKLTAVDVQEFLILWLLSILYVSHSHYHDIFFLHAMANNEDWRIMCPSCGSFGIHSISNLTYVCHVKRQTGSISFWKIDAWQMILAIQLQNKYWRWAT